MFARDSLHQSVIAQSSEVHQTNSERKENLEAFKLQYLQNSKILLLVIRINDNIHIYFQNNSFLFPCVPNQGT